MTSKFRRMKLQSILTRNEADTMPLDWIKAIYFVASMKMWSPVERTILERYARMLTSFSDQWDCLYPPSPRYTGSLSDCLIYYVGYWSGKMRDLRRRFIQTGEYSPRAWGLLKNPLITMQCGLTSVTMSNDRGTYALHLD